MQLYTRRIYGSIAETATNVANILLIRTSKILAVHWAIKGIAGAAVDGAGNAELSRINLSQLGVHDAPNVISTVGWSAPINAGTFKLNQYVPCGGLEIRAGDYLYLHCNRTGTLTTANLCYVTLYLSD